MFNYLKLMYTCEEMYICEESWVPKNWCFWTVVSEKTLEGPLDYKEIQPVHPKGDQSWVFFGRTDAKAETPKLWVPHVKSWLIGKDPDAGKDWRQEKKRMTENEMVGWHHRLSRLSLGKLWELVMDREAWSAAVHGVTKSWTLLSNWTEQFSPSASLDGITDSLNMSLNKLLEIVKDRKAWCAAVHAVSKS